MSQIIPSPPNLRIKVVSVCSRAEHRSDNYVSVANRACVGFGAHDGRIKYLLIAPGLQVPPLLSLIARTLCSPDNPTQHSPSPSLICHIYFILCISLASARMVKATGSDKKEDN